WLHHQLLVCPCKSVRRAQLGGSQNITPLPSNVRLLYKRIPNYVNAEYVNDTEYVKEFTDEEFEILTWRHSTT
ncbi:MAG: hypothetical protein ACKPKO_38530, partial [Candidatus Fonsibacter sp.]